MNKCNHKLKYNKEEDYIFCIECGKQQGMNTYINTPYMPLYPNLPQYPTYVTCIN